MARTRTVLMDEFHLAVYAPRELSPAEFTQLRRALDEPRLKALLRRAVRAVFNTRPGLGKVRVAVTQ